MLPILSTAIAAKAETTHPCTQVYRTALGTTKVPRISHGERSRAVWPRLTSRPYGLCGEWLRACLIVVNIQSLIHTKSTRKGAETIAPQSD